jgi:hypothetical protein
MEEGDEAGFFFPEEAQAKERAEEEGNVLLFKEAKVKWRKSKAKRILYDLLRDGTVSLKNTMPIEEIFALSPEFAL